MADDYLSELMKKAREKNAPSSENQADSLKNNEKATQSTNSFNSSDNKELQTPELKSIPQSINNQPSENLQPKTFTSESNDPFELAKQIKEQNKNYSNSNPQEIINEPTEENFETINKKTVEDREEELAKTVQINDISKVKERIDSEASFNIEPSNEKTVADKELETAKKTELTSYGKVTIYKIPEKPLPYYVIPATRPTAAERRIINTIKEATTRLISISRLKIRDPEQRRIVYKQKVLEILKNTPTMKIPETKINFYAEAVVREMVGYGLIDDLIKDDLLEEIMVVGPKKPVYVFHRDYEMMATNIEFFSEQEIEDLVNRIAREVGRRVDVSTPLLDARLPDGSRVNATIPPASISGGTLTIRKFKADPYTIIDLVRLGTLTSEAAAFLWVCVEGMGVKPANILISGGTGSGKTTLLNVMASFIPDRERVITIEDTAELKLPIEHWIRMESRPPGLEGTGELRMDVITKNALRMRPDRIIVGEIRHEEAFTLFTAMNTGHDGALTPDALLQLSNGNIIEMGALAGKFKNYIPDGEYEFTELNQDIQVPSLNKESLLVENKKITRIWRKKIRDDLIKIKLKSGKTITLTKDHPLYKIQNGIVEINGSQAREGDYLAVPKKVLVNSDEKIKEPYLLGLIYGDGHLGKEGISFVNKEIKLINEFNKHSSKITKNKISQFNYNTFSRIQVYDKKMVNYLNKNYKIPIGNKTKIFKFENEILCTNKKDLSKILKGFYDCEGHVNLHSNSIQLNISNNDVAKKLPLILQRYGIHSSTYSQLTDGKGNIGPYYRISIYGKENIIAFQKNIGFSHPKKLEQLKKLKEQSKNSIDIFPNITKLLRDSRSEAKLTQKELSGLMGAKTRSTINAYESCQRSPTREKLTQISEVLSEKNSKKLKILSESDLLFEKIVSVKIEKYAGFVYDLTIEDNHNYIANGMFVGNCMGTVHANSAQETLIRVTNPPMNVPSIMMSGLDFVIVENRLHDRRKGTIRRIIEIAEVKGALEGKLQTEVIYQWDPVKDEIEKTLVDSAYIKTLADFNGTTRDQIYSEIELRKQFIDNLLKQNIRGIQKVSSESKKFLQGRRMMD